MLAATGRRALTWYLGHVVVLVTLYATDMKNSPRRACAIAVGAGLFGVAALGSYYFRETTGTLESWMRRLSDGTPTPALTQN